MKKILFFLLLPLFFAHPARADTSTTTPPYNDIKVEKITVSPPNPVVNQRAIITVQIKNIGTNSLISSLGFGSYSYQFNNFSVSSFKYSPPSYESGQILSPNNSMYYYAEGIFTKIGTTSLSFIINDNQELTEEKRTSTGTIRFYSDDSAIASVGVQPASNQDLAVTAIMVSSENPIVNSDLTLTVELKNTGKTSITNAAIFDQNNYTRNFGDFQTASASSSPMPTISAPLNPGSIFNYIFTGRFPTYGIKQLSFVMDKNNMLDGSDKTNDSYSTTTRIYLNQAEVDDFVLAEPTADSTGSTSIKVFVVTSKQTSVKVYYGSGPIVSDFKSVESKDKTIHEIPVSGLAPGTKYRLDIVASRGAATKRGDKFYEITTLMSDEPHFLEKPSVVTGKSSATVSWKTDLAVSAKVFYRKSGVTAYISTSSEYMPSAGMLNVINLAAGDYQYYVQISANKFTSSSTVAGFKISSAPIPDGNQSAGGERLAGTAKSEAKIILDSGKNLNEILDHTKKKKSIKDQNYAMKKFTNPLVRGYKVTVAHKYSVNNFIVYGSASSARLSAKQRVDILGIYKKKYKKIPATETDWNNVLSLIKK